MLEKREFCSHTHTHTHTTHTQPPPEADRNGVISRYHIFFRQINEGEGPNSTSDPRAFSLAEHTPSDPNARSHSARLGGLAGGRSYQVKIRAVTSVGVGPNSTLVTMETLEREQQTIPCCTSSFPFMSFLTLVCLLLSLSPTQRFL